MKNQNIIYKLWTIVIIVFTCINTCGLLLPEPTELDIAIHRNPEINIPIYMDKYNLSGDEMLVLLEIQIKKYFNSCICCRLHGGDCAPNSLKRAVFSMQYTGSDKVLETIKSYTTDEYDIKIRTIMGEEYFHVKRCMSKPSFSTIPSKQPIFNKIKPFIASVCKWFSTDKYIWRSVVFVLAVSWLIYRCVRKRK